MNDDYRQCGTCHIGSLHWLTVTYAYRWHTRLIVVPNVNAWACDVCEEFIIDPEMLARLEMLLGSQPVTARNASPFTTGGRSAAFLSPSGRQRGA